MLGVTFILVLGNTLDQAPARVLPEMTTHIRYAQRCIRNGWDDALAASLSVIAPKRLKVFVPEGEARRVEAVVRAASMWEKECDGDLRFSYVARPENADIVIQFVIEIRDAEGEAGGFANWKRSVTHSTAGFVGQTKATVKLALRAQRRNLSDSSLLHAALHEFGHVLGLDDSSTIGDVMGPLDPRRPVTAPRLAEISALRRLRSLASGSARS